MMLIILQISALAFIIVMIFLSIWSFVIANKVYLQIKYKNYLLEKISEELSILNKKDKV